MALSSLIRYVRALDSSATDGSGKTGLAFGDVTAKYLTMAGTLTSLTTETITTLGTYQAPTSAAHVRIKELAGSDPTKGVYEVHFHNTQLAAAGKRLWLFLSATGAAFIPLEVDLLANDVVSINQIATTSVTTVNANVGTVQPIAFSGTGGSALPDVNAVKAGPTGAGVAITALTITHLNTIYDTDYATVYDTTNKAFLSKLGNFAMGGSSLALTTGAIACTTITASGAVAFQTTFIVTGATTFTGAVTATNASNDIAGIDVKKISGDSAAADNAESFFDGTGYAGTNNVIPTVTTVTNQLTAAQIATGVWQDATAGDFTTASSIGKALYVSNVAPGGSGGHMISGSNSGTTTFNAFTVTNAFTVSGATTLTGAVTASNASNNITGIDVAKISGDATAADNAEAFFDGTGYAGTNNVIPLVTLTTTTTTATNVTTVNGLAAGVITAASIAADAIGASELAADAIAEIAAGVWDLATSGHTTSGTFGAAAVAAGGAGDPWSTSLPGAYGAGTAGFIVGTNIDAAISSRMAAGATVVLTDASLTTAKLGAFALAKTTNITGFNDLSAAQVNAEADAALADYDGPTHAEMTAEIPTATQNADALLKRDWTSVTGEALRSVLNALRFLRNKWSVSGTTLTVTTEDDATPAWTSTVTTDAAAEPITGSDPS